MSHRQLDDHTTYLEGKNLPCFLGGISLSAPPSSLFPTTQLRLSPDGSGRADLTSRTAFTLRGDGEPGSVNICKFCCSSPVHFREPLTNHARCSSDKQCYNWASIPAREVRACRGQTDVRLLCWRLLARAEPTENKRRAQSIISYSPLPRFFDFKTFNARIINGSTPFSISVFLLSSLMSTGTPLPS